MTGTELITLERQRQIQQEGWTPDHDAQHQDSELAFAACYYAMPCMLLRRCGNEEPCPVHPDEFFTETGWDKKWAKREEKSRIRRLVVAGALIAAEIDRLQAIEARCIGLSLCGGPCDESCPSVRARECKSSNHCALQDAKSLVVFAHGENFAAVIASMRALLDRMEAGAESDDNCVDPNNRVEWDSSPLEHKSMGEFFEDAKVEK